MPGLIRWWVLRAWRDRLLARARAALRRAPPPLPGPPVTTAEFIALVDKAYLPAILERANSESTLLRMLQDCAERQEQLQDFPLTLPERPIVGRPFLVSLFEEDPFSGHHILAQDRMACALCAIPFRSWRPFEKCSGAPERSPEAAHQP